MLSLADIFLYFNTTDALLSKLHEESSSFIKGLPVRKKHNSFWILNFGFLGNVSLIPFIFSGVPGGVYRGLGPVRIGEN